MFLPRAFAALPFASLLLCAPLASAATFEIDSSHSMAQFSVRHLMISNVRGEFGKVTGTIEYDAKSPQKTQITASIDAATVNTREAKRDEHLRSPDFFDVAKFPAITFKSKRVEATAGKLKVYGDLTMRGISKEVALDVEGPTPEIKDPWGNMKIGASATTKVNRKDFGLLWNKALEAGGVVVGDEVTITLDIELSKKAEKAKAAPSPKK